MGSEGGVFKTTFPANDPPEEEATLKFLVDVGVSGNSANLEASIKLIPHFRLTAASFQVQRGNNLTLKCTDSVNAGAVVITPSEGITTNVSGSNVTITVGATAAMVLRRVVVEDAANSNHKARRTIEIIP